MADNQRAFPRGAIPGSALILGWLGVLPFAGLCFFSTTGVLLSRSQASDALAVYGVIILAFMGGVRWGLAIVEVPDRRTPDSVALLASVVPPLVAFGCWFLPRTAGLLGLIAGFAVLFVYDLLTSREVHAPAWYPKLRGQLTAAVVICLGAAAVLT